MSNLTVRHHEIRKVLIVELLFNLLVATAKLIIGYATSTLAMVADGYHSLFDASSNIIGFITIRFAYEPADEDHQYGHRKYEAVAAMAISLALFAAAYRILAEAYTRLQDPSVQPEVGVASFLVMLGTMAVNIGVSNYEAREAKRLQSQLLASDAAHTRSDVFASAAVIVALIAAYLGYGWIDIAASIAIAVIILRIGYHIVRDSLSVISDALVIEPEKVREIVLAVDGVADVADVRSRGTADHVFMDLVCFVAASMTMAEGHELADRVEDRIHGEFPSVQDIVVHLAPIEVRDDHGRQRQRRR